MTDIFTDTPKGAFVGQIKATLETQGDSDHPDLIVSFEPDKDCQNGFKVVDGDNFTIRICPREVNAFMRAAKLGMHGEERSVNEPPQFLAIGPGYWGRGDSINAAKRALSNAGGSVRDPHIVYVTDSKEPYVNNWGSAMFPNATYAVTVIDTTG